MYCYNLKCLQPNIQYITLCIITLLSVALSVMYVAIISHIRSRPKGRAKCPVGGCPAYVLEDDLEIDEEMEKLIRRSQRSQRH